MTAQDIFRRLRIATAIVAGFLFGKLLALIMGHHASEFFIAGFASGFLATHWLFRIMDAAGENTDAGED